MAKECRRVVTKEPHGLAFEDAKNWGWVPVSLRDTVKGTLDARGFKPTATFAPSLRDEIQLAQWQRCLTLSLILRCAEGL